MNTEPWAIALTLIATTIGSFGPLFLKKSSENFSLNPLKQLKNYNLMIGLTFYIVSTLLFIPALKGGDLSVLYPMLALVYVWVSLLSMFFLKEKMNKTKWLGVTLIILGVTLIGLGA